MSFQRQGTNRLSTLQVRTGTSSGSTPQNQQQAKENQYPTSRHHLVSAIGTGSRSVKNRVAGTIMAALPKANSEITRTHFSQTLKMAHQNSNPLQEIQNRSNKRANNLPIQSNSAKQRPRRRLQAGFAASTSSSRHKTKEESKERRSCSNRASANSTSRKQPQSRSKSKKRATQQGNKVMQQKDGVVGFIPKQQLTLDVDHHHLEEPANFELIRELISPQADDTQTFLQQVNMQLNQLPGGVVGVDCGNFSESRSQDAFGCENEPTSIYERCYVQNQQNGQHVRLNTLQSLDLSDIMGSVGENIRGQQQAQQQNLLHTEGSYTENEIQGAKFAEESEDNLDSGSLIIAGMNENQPELVSPQTAIIEHDFAEADPKTTIEIGNMPGHIVEPQTERAENTSHTIQTSKVGKGAGLTSGRDAVSHLDYASLIERRKSMSHISSNANNSKNALGSQRITTLGGLKEAPTQIISARSGGFTARNVQNSYLASFDRIITADELRNSLNDDKEHQNVQMQSADYQQELLPQQHTMVANSNFVASGELEAVVSSGYSRTFQKSNSNSKNPSLATFGIFGGQFGGTMNSQPISSPQNQNYQNRGGQWTMTDPSNPIPDLQTEQDEVNGQPQHSQIQGDAKKQKAKKRFSQNSKGKAALEANKSLSRNTVAKFIKSALDRKEKRKTVVKIPGVQRRLSTINTNTSVIESQGGLSQRSFLQNSKNFGGQETLQKIQKEKRANSNLNLRQQTIVNNLSKGKSSLGKQTSTVSQQIKNQQERRGGSLQKRNPSQKHRTSKSRQGRDGVKSLTRQGRFQPGNCGFGTSEKIQIPSARTASVKDAARSIQNHNSNQNSGQGIKSKRRTSVQQQNIQKNTRQGGFGRCGSSLSQKSSSLSSGIKVPELNMHSLSQSNVYNSINDSNFIDETDDSERSLFDLDRLYSHLKFVGDKIDFYAQLVTLEEVKNLSKYEKSPSSATMKAARCLCLVLKAFTGMSSSFRQIKDEETFGDWEKVLQYLRSEQGCDQIEALGEIRLFCDQQNNLCDKTTLLADLRKIVFAGSLARESVYQGANFDLDSPRVKNLPLKPFFCLGYFTMIYVAIQDQINSVAEKISSQEKRSQISQGSPQARKSIMSSPGLNKITIANISIANGVTAENTRIEDSQGTVNIKATQSMIGNDQNQTSIETVKHLDLTKVAKKETRQISQTNQPATQNGLPPQRRQIEVYSSKKKELRSDKKDQDYDMFSSHFKLTQPNINATLESESAPNMNNQQALHQHQSVLHQQAFHESLAGMNMISSVGKQSSSHHKEERGLGAENNNNYSDDAHKREGVNNSIQLSIGTRKSHDQNLAAEQMIQLQPQQRPGTVCSMPGNGLLPFDQADLDPDQNQLGFEQRYQTSYPQFVEEIGESRNRSSIDTTTSLSLQMLQQEEQQKYSLTQQKPSAIPQQTSSTAKQSDFTFYQMQWQNQNQLNVGGCGSIIAPHPYINDERQNGQMQEFKEEYDGQNQEIIPKKNGGEASPERRISECFINALQSQKQTNGANAQVKVQDLIRQIQDEIQENRRSNEGQENISEEIENNLDEQQPEMIPVIATRQQPYKPEEQYAIVKEGNSPANDVDVDVLINAKEARNDRFELQAEPSEITDSSKEIRQNSQIQNQNVKSWFQAAPTLTLGHNLQEQSSLLSEEEQSSSLQQMNTVVLLRQASPASSSERKFRQKLGRTKEEILNSIKKRRMQSCENNMTRNNGQDLDQLADNIVKQCETVLESIGQSSQTQSSTKQWLEFGPTTESFESNATGKFNNVQGGGEFQEVISPEDARESCEKIGVQKNLLKDFNEEKDPYRLSNLKLSQNGLLLPQKSEDSRQQQDCYAEREPQQNLSLEFQRFYQDQEDSNDQFLNVQGERSAFELDENSP